MSPWPRQIKFSTEAEPVIGATAKQGAMHRARSTVYHCDKSLPLLLLRHFQKMASCNACRIWHKVLCLFHSIYYLFSSSVCAQVFFLSSAQTLLMLGLETAIMCALQM